MQIYHLSMLFHVLKIGGIALSNTVRSSIAYLRFITIYPFFRLSLQATMGCFVCFRCYTMKKWVFLLHHHCINVFLLVVMARVPIFGLPIAKKSKVMPHLKFFEGSYLHMLLYLHAEFPFGLYWSYFFYQHIVFKT